MATVISKSTRLTEQNSARVVYLLDNNDNLDSDARTFTVDAGNGNTVDVTFVPTVIDLVINPNATAVTIDGKTYATGTFNYNQVGGMPIDSGRANEDVVISTANDAVVELRGYLTEQHNFVQN